MKKVIFIGTVGCGKTTLSQRLTGERLSYKKTQTIEVVGSGIIDTPGEYLDRVQMRGALMISSADADLICLVQSATDIKSMFPPAYAGSFAKEVIGVVTKIDAATDAEMQLARERLKMAGAAEVFMVSSLSGEGLDTLEDKLCT